MNDLISRQAAVDAMMKLQAEDIEAYGASIPEGFDGDRAVTALKSLPSADRPIGEWIDNGDRYYRCSLCGTKDTDTWDWCHGCGCRMKGADDD